MLIKYLRFFIVSISLFGIYVGDGYGVDAQNNVTGAFEECINRILSKDDNKNGKPDFAEELDKTLGNPKDIQSFESAANAKSKVIAVAITGAAFHKDGGVCNDLIMKIANEPKEEFNIELIKFNKKVRFKISKKKLLEQYQVALGILVTKNSDWQYPKIINRDYIKEKTWSNDCSDYLSANPFDSVYDSDPVNISMQKIKSYDNEYFLDEPEHMQAFPGLVIEDVTHQDLANLVIINDIPAGQELISKFATNVSSLGKCKGNYAYLVSYVVPEKINTGTGAGQAYAVNFAVAGIATATIAYAGAAYAATGTLAGIFTAAGASATVPVAGWIVAGALVVVGGVVAFVSSTTTETLADLPQMMVIDGPYPL